MPRCQSFPEMDPRIWSKLPEELLYCILCFLSPKTIFNLRSTCKRFKSLLLDPCFISTYSFSSSNFSSFLLLSHPHFNRHFPLYDTLSCSWRQPTSTRSLLNPCTSSSSLLSSSNGVLCFYLPASSSFLVANPLSRASTTVKFPKLPFSFEIITLVSFSSGFKIFVSSSSSVFLYDSRSKSWGRFGVFDSVLNDSFHQGGVYRDGQLYFTTCDPFSVVCFDLETGNCRMRFDDLELPTNELAFVRLAGADNAEGEGGGIGIGKLYMVGGVGRNGISRCLKLWALSEKEGEKWIEVETLPDLMYKKFVSVCYHNYEHIYCFWHRGLICICCYTWPEILYYRIARRTWHWFPKCPFLPDKWSCGFRWFSFVPTLHAPV